MSITEDDRQQPPSAPRSGRPDPRAVRNLARSLARDLAASGLHTDHLIALASELLDEAAQRMRDARAERRA